MRLVSYHCSVPDDASKLNIDKTLIALTALLSDCPIQFTTSSSSLSLVQIQQHAFTGQTTQSSSVGLVGILRCIACPELQGLDLSSSQRAILESWIQTADQTLLPIVRQGKKDPIFKAAVEEFALNMERYFFDSDQTTLVGDYWTLGDLVVAVALAATSPPNLPQQVFRWCLTVLNRILACLSRIDHYNHIDASTVKDIIELVTKWTQNIHEGLASPLEKVMQVEINTAAGATNSPSAPGTSKTTYEETTTTATPSATTTTTTTPSDASAPDNPILTMLLSMNLDHSVYSHPACTTAEELVTNVPIPSTDSHTKNLFLRDKKHGMFLVTVRPDANVQTKQLGQDLHLAGKTNLRLADEATLLEKLACKPGCVGPLAIGLAPKSDNNSEEEKITLVLDRELLQVSGHIHSHPLRNDMSVQMRPAALQEFLQKVGVEPVIVDFARTETSGKDSDGKKVAPVTTAPVVVKPSKKAEPTPSHDVTAANKNKKSVKKGETLLALQWQKQENFPMWYADVIVLSEMIAYYDISGCYILRPWSYKIWELIQEWFNGMIGAMGVENAYFPLFVSQERLEREKDHVEGFAPEVAWVTKSGSGDLAKPIAIRPTSETIMYPAYSDWIKSHRDLPLKLNQWSNVVRWEFKYPTPFLRTREFLWQEGHTAHASFEDADKMVMDILDLYRRVYEELLAVPVVPGYKTEKEKFAGGFRTTTVEAYIAGSGRAIQGATSHNLGQNFGRMFDITFQDEKGTSQVAWQTSWGLTTRTIGVMVMVHGDDTGLVLPPKIAPVQVVIVPIISKNLTNEEAAPYCKAVLDDLVSIGIRAKLDDRTLYNPGWKYNHWEQKGVPIRIEVGPRDIEQKSARLVIRHDGSKEDHPVRDIGVLIKAKLEEIQQAMFAKAKAARDKHLVQVTEWKDFVPNLEKNNLVLTPWCGGEHKDWEEWVKETSRAESLKARGEEIEDEQTSTSVAAKTLCIPFIQPELPPGTKCIASGLEATCWVLWGRSY